MFPTLERWLGSGRLLTWLNRELERAQLRWQASTVVALSAFLMVFVLTVTAIGVSALVPTLSPLGCLGCAVLTATVVPLVGLAWLRWRQRRFVQRVETILPDTLALIANALRSGMSLQQALEVAAREGLPPLRDEFAAVNRALVLGASLEEALQGLMERVPSTELRLAMVAVLVQREVGGSLAQIFETAGTTVRRRLQVRRELHAETALVRFSAFALAFGLPLFLLIAVNAVTYLQTGEAWSAPMFVEPTGRWVWVLIAALEVSGWLWLSSILNAMTE
jgi:tight adherence protein B